MSEVKRYEVLAQKSGQDFSLAPIQMVEASDYDTLAAQRDEGLAREAELRKERDVFRAALEGAGYRGLDNMQEHGADFARDIGRAIAALTMGIQGERDSLKQRLAEAGKLKTAVLDAMSAFERRGAECELEGQAMIYAAVLEALATLATPGCADGEKS